MACEKDNQITFAVYELYPDGKEFDTGRTFSVLDGEGDYIIVRTMFNTLYQFTIGPNGFQVIWDNDENGVPQTMKQGKFHWAGPRPPAQQIGGNWWAIKRVV